MSASPIDSETSTSVVRLFSCCRLIMHYHPFFSPHIKRIISCCSWWGFLLMRRCDCYSWDDFWRLSQFFLLSRVLCVGHALMCGVKIDTWNCLEGDDGDDDSNSGGGCIGRLGGKQTSLSLSSFLSARQTKKKTKRKTEASIENVGGWWWCSFETKQRWCIVVAVSSPTHPLLLSGTTATAQEGCRERLGQKAKWKKRTEKKKKTNKVCLTGRPTKKCLNFRGKRKKFVACIHARAFEKAREKRTHEKPRLFQIPRVHGFLRDAWSQLSCTHVIMMHCECSFLREAWIFLQHDYFSHLFISVGRFCMGVSLLADRRGLSVITTNNSLLN